MELNQLKLIFCISKAFFPDSFQSQLRLFITSILHLIICTLINIYYSGLNCLVIINLRTLNSTNIYNKTISDLVCSKDRQRKSFRNR